MRSICIAALLAVFASLAHAQTQIDTRPKRVEPSLDSSFLGPKLDGTLRPPTTGLSEPKQGIRTIRIFPPKASAPERPHRYFVQITAQRTSREAQDRFDEIKERFPALKDRQGVIMRTDAGVSTVYRAMVGPFGDLADANEMCSGLKAQGGPCVVHRIDPEEQGPVADTPAPRRAETVPTEAAVGTAGGYFVQISAQRTEDELRAAVEALRAKYPGVIGDRPLVIRRIDLGDKGGSWYRGQFGPFGTAADAMKLCNELKNAGGQCIVQRHD